MSDKELAERVVALGAGKKIDSIYYSWGQQAGKFVRDWRVAGALMEKCLSVEFITVRRTGERSAVARAGGPTSDAVDLSLPRAICEACVEALEQDNE